MAKLYDIVVIGSGVAGKATASALASKGKNVAIIEADMWGGTCPNKGCDPKKVLVSAVEALNRTAQLKGSGIDTVPSVNWPDLMSFKQTFTDPVPDHTKESLRSSGVDTYSGTAEFKNEETLVVNGHELNADYFVIATGARPNILNIEGKEHFLTSDDFLSLPDMPDTVTFVGGGYISFEFAAIANAAGADVHIIQHNSTPLKAYDQEFVNEVMTQLKNKGVSFHLDTSIQTLTKTSEGFELSDGSDFQLTTDLVFCTTGRVPNVEVLNLAKAGVDFDKTGIKADDYLRSTNPKIYAIGDVLNKTQPKLTPVSSLEANYVVSLLSGENVKPLIYPSIPSIVFSSPKLAQVGVSTAEAVQNPDSYDHSSIDATDWFSYKRLNEPVSKVKIVTEKKSNLLVGATVLNNEADELINYFSLLINQKITSAELSDIVFAYPTPASDLSYFYS